MRNRTIAFAAIITALLCSSCANIETRKEIKRNATKESIRKKVAEKQDELTQCYGEKVVENNKDEEANLLVSWHINDAGKAINAEVLESSTENKDFGKCILNTLESVEFEKPGKTHATIKMPFIFSTN